MWHKPCRTFHPWCLCIKTRCLSPMICQLGVRVVLFLVVSWCHKASYLFWANGLLGITTSHLTTQIAKFIGPTWCPPGSCRPQVGPMLAPWTLLSGHQGELMVHVCCGATCLSHKAHGMHRRLLHKYLWNCYLYDSFVKVTDSVCGNDTYVQILTAWDWQEILNDRWVIRT